MIENPHAITILRDLGTRESIHEYLLIIYGRINQEIIISAIKLAESKLLLEKFPKQTITKMKIITAELLQNVVKHQVVHEKSPPYFILGFNGKILHILAGNCLSEKSMDSVIENIEKYKKIKKEDLREYYIETFKKARISAEGNAGLGLLDIVFRADQNVRYKTAPFMKGLFSFELHIVLNPGSASNT